MILAIDRSKRNAVSLADMFFRMGVLSKGVTPSEALSEVSLRYNAIIIINPHALPDTVDYIRRLVLYSGKIPIFSVGDDKGLYKNLFNLNFSNTSYAAKIYKSICEFNRNIGYKSPGIYRIMGIDVSADLPCAMYFDKPLPFTKTENMILKTLIVAYPQPANAKEILKYAFRNSRKPEQSSIRTHISVMNKKYREVTNRNLILLCPGEGYKLLTLENISVTV